MQHSISPTWFDLFAFTPPPHRIITFIFSTGTGCSLPFPNGPVFSWRAHPWRMMEFPNVRYRINVVCPETVCQFTSAIETAYPRRTVCTVACVENEINQRSNCAPKRTVSAIEDIASLSPFDHDCFVFTVPGDKGTKRLMYLKPSNGIIS